ncbi:ribosome maturation factor RimM [Paraburkholderia phymatum]|uniref:Ribosome maturation factor RimM n=1 Tax=Paraburkholderia phymatum (strain DSM 17167 / CIP 108236 / LMG 21445 / STM815) TaxID=391038 RepID=RIMM_PARP8|nr:ribosome maturation factor RimM [Paraburkholderia phymatum]B2JF30.1 RecName: Full=Ribosome maturation factor RimM [Paraburkholderia phymatum STM815]ACC69959.1 16S rRNA processing protein RimM [Paraburkholderia phymatum STM815]
MSERDSGSSGRAKAKRQPGAKAPFGPFVRKPVEKVEANAAAAQKARAESAESWPDDAVEVGAIVDAYGLKGWVKVAAHADAGHGGDALLSTKRWWLEKGRERQSTPCLQSKVHGDSIVAQLGGTADRDAALALRGHRVYVRRRDFPALGTDEYYWVDLVGLDVVNEAGIELGKVADLIDNGAQSVLRIEYPAIGKDGKPVIGERLIPFVGVYVKTVDQAAKKIIVDWEADY